MSDVREEKVRSVDRKMGAGRQTLRISRIEGAEDALVLAVGFGDTPEDFMRPSWGALPIRLPWRAAPDLIAALRELGAE